ncbi:hypothetical protein MMC25_000840 [Agyrium rufum]|nr:hypothetical protein [Agyrium rufum]
MTTISNPYRNCASSLSSSPASCPPLIALLKITDILPKNKRLTHPIPRTSSFVRPWLNHIEAYVLGRVEHLSWTEINVFRRGYSIRPEDCPDTILVCIKSYSAEHGISYTWQEAAMEIAEYCLERGIVVDVEVQESMGWGALAKPNLELPDRRLGLVIGSPLRRELIEDDFESSELDDSVCSHDFPSRGM